MPSPLPLRRLPSSLSPPAPLLSSLPSPSSHDAPGEEVAATVSRGQRKVERRTIDGEGRGEKRGKDGAGEGEAEGWGSVRERGKREKDRVGEGMVEGGGREGGDGHRDHFVPWAKLLLLPSRGEASTKSSSSPTPFVLLTAVLLFPPLLICSFTGWPTSLAVSVFLSILQALPPQHFSPSRSPHPFSPSSPT